MGCGGCGKKRKAAQAVEQKRKEMPSLATRAKNFAKASVKHILTGSRIVDRDTMRKRYKICIECDTHYDVRSKACTKCGCYVRTKTRWADQECPLDPPKWKAVE